MSALPVVADPQPWSADPYAVALRTGRGPLYLRRPDGWALPLEVERWCAGADPADATVLGRCRPPVLDVGCGPGRLVVALGRQGSPALGVDTSPVAVSHTRAAGGAALCRSVFDPLPGEGRWRTGLLIDGNIGIGGDPLALLTRVRRLLAPGGSLLVEVALADVEERVEVRLEDARGGQGPSFPWARIGATALRARARAAGWTVGEEWDALGRRFLRLDNVAGAADGARPDRLAVAGEGERP